MGLGEGTLSWDAGAGKLFPTVSACVPGFPAGDVSTVLILVPLWAASWHFLWLQLLLV